MNQHQTIRRRQRRQRQHYNRRLRKQSQLDEAAWGIGQPDWPKEELSINHCEDCYQSHKGTYHWCTFIPGYDRETCPICSWQVNSPYTIHPVLYLLHVPYLNSSLCAGIKFVNSFDYQPFWKRAIFQTAVIITSLFIARQL